MAKNQLTNLMISEISLVDDPANPEAFVSLWKSTKKPQKENDMTKMTEEQKKGFAKSILAMIFKSVDGEGDDNAQDDDKDAPKEKTDEEKAAEAAEAELQKAFKKSAEAGLTEEQKAFYDTLDTAGKAEFIAKDETARAEFMLGKSKVDPEKEALKKQVEELQKAKDAAEGKATDAEFLAKAKAEFANVAGTPEEKAELLKFVATTVQKSSADMAGLIDKIMKQAQANIAASTEENGHSADDVETQSDVSDDKDPKIAYEKSIKTIMEKHKLNRTDAIKKLKSTPEGREVYQKSLAPTA